MIVWRILMLALAAASLALVSGQSAWAHPPEDHGDTAVIVNQPAPTADPVEAPEQSPATTGDASFHDQAMPHDHGSASTSQENSAPADDLHSDAAPHAHDTAVPHQDTGAAAASHHDEAAPHAHDAGADAEPGHHEGTGHSHWGDNGANTPLEKAVEALGAYHPLLVHFPIALLLAAALAQALSLAGVGNSNADIVRFLVWTGAFGGLAAGLLGWAHAGPMASDEAGVMLAHRWIGSSLTLGLFGVAAAVEWHRKSPGNLTALVMNTALFTAAAAVAINGFLGGSLAHGGVNHLMEM